MLWLRCCRSTAAVAAIYVPSARCFSFLYFVDRAANPKCSHKASCPGSMLSHACKIYVGKQSEICESVLLYDNNERQAELMATVSDGKGVEEAMALVEKYLGPDAQPK